MGRRHLNPRSSGLSQAPAKTTAQYPRARNVKSEFRSPWPKKRTLTGRAALAERMASQGSHNSAFIYRSSVTLNEQ